MIYYYDLKQRCIRKTATLFVMAVNSKIHLKVITKDFEDSVLIRQIENNDYTKIYDESIYDLYEEIFGFPYREENPFLNFNDAYWCGYVYANIFYRYQKPFSYIFSVLPLEFLMDKYPVYHEMDLGQIYEVFEESENKETVFGRLLKEKKISMAFLSRQTVISVNTLKKYKESNDNLYNGKFAILKKITDKLMVNDHLFLEKIDIDENMVKV